MLKHGQLIKTKNGIYKRLILDLSNYINSISKKKELFTCESIGKMNTKEFEQNEKKIMMQMNSIGIPTEYEFKISKEQDYENDQTVTWVWVLDDSLKNHCDFCREMEGKTFENEEDAPERPVHENCGCELIRAVLV